MSLVNVMVAAVVCNRMMMEVAMMVGGHSAAIYGNGGSSGGQWSNKEGKTRGGKHRCLYQGTLVRAVAQTPTVLYHGIMTLQFCARLHLFACNFNGVSATNLDDIVGRRCISCAGEGTSLNVSHGPGRCMTKTQLQYRQWHTRQGRAIVHWGVCERYCGSVQRPFPRVVTGVEVLGGVW